MSLTLISHVTKCTHFLRFTNLAFFQDFFRVGKIYCYANFYHYANFSIVFEPNFGGGQTASGGLSGTKPANSVTVGHFANLFVNPCAYSVHWIQCTLILVFQPLSLSYVSFPKTVPSNDLSFSIKDLCAGPKLETAHNWKRVRSFHFWVSPKLETAAVSTFGLDPKQETQLPDQKVETSL